MSYVGNSGKDLVTRLGREKFIMYCDNLNTVRAINSKCSRDLKIQQCLRELHTFLGIYSCDVKAEFIEGISNRIPDALSRWHKHPKHQREFAQLTKKVKTREVTITRELWQFFV